MLGSSDQVFRVDWKNGYSNIIIFSFLVLILKTHLTSSLESSQEEDGGKNTTVKLFDARGVSDDELKQHLQEFGVHYSLQSVLSVLQKPEIQNEEAVRVFLHKYYEEKRKAPNSLPPNFFRHPVISIDGFFTHGRTKVTKIVASALKGRRMLLPTRHVARLRSYFSSDLLRKHYYSLSKYMGANMAMVYCRSAPVILERYWHDQAAFVIAKSFNTLIQENSTVYDFPSDLLIPDLMFFVNGALNQHLHNETTTNLHIHSPLTLKILEVFRRMRPKLIEIGPPDLPRPMADKILNIVEGIQHKFLPKPLEKPNWNNH